MMSELEITDEHKQCVSVAIISVPAPRTPVSEGWRWPPSHELQSADLS